MFITTIKILLKASDVLESERSAFFGFVREIPSSGNTVELVEQLQAAVFETAVVGDRRVRRYFEEYGTPFFGGTS